MPQAIRVKILPATATKPVRLRADIKPADLPAHSQTKSRGMLECDLLDFGATQAESQTLERQIQRIAYIAALSADLRNWRSYMRGTVGEFGNDYYVTPVAPLRSDQIALIDTVAEHTECNDHNAARIVIAEFFELSELCAQFEAIRESHTERGHITGFEIQRREQLTREMFENIRKRSTGNFADLIWNAL